MDETERPLVTALTGEQDDGKHNLWVLVLLAWLLLLALVLYIPGMP